MNSDLLKLIRHDVRRWPGAKSIRDLDNNDDTLAPSTIGHLVDVALAGDPRARELGAVAESTQWTRAHADELLDLLADRLAQANDAWGGADFEAHLRAQATGRAGAKKRAASRGMELAPLQRLILDAERALGEQATDANIADHLAYSGFNHSPSNVGKARAILRKKGL